MSAFSSRALSLLLLCARGRPAVPFAAMHLSTSLGIGARAGLGFTATGARPSRRLATAATTRNGSSDASSAPPPPAEQQQQQQQERFVVSARELLRDYRGAQRVRVDQYLADRWPAARALAAGASASRARVQQALKSGRVTVNGQACTKPSAGLRAGDVVLASLPPPEPLARAEPEAGLDLRVVWEDAHCAVVFKPAGMVVHPSPGHPRGTLVNALLHHLGLPAMEAGEVLSGSVFFREDDEDGVGEGGGGEDDDDDGDLFSEEEEEDDDGEMMADAAAAGATAAAAAESGRRRQQPPPPPPPLPSPNQNVVRPGIVHRLDRGTTGLMVVAKTDAAHARLCAQFKARTVGRVYASVLAPLQWPPPLVGAGSGGGSLLALAASNPDGSGRVATNVARDPRDRLRMAAAPYGSARGRPAASNFRVLGTAANARGAAAAAQAAGREGGWGGFKEGGGGGVAASVPPLVVEWRLETGRTHQIRVHARHLGWPLLGDDAYGPGSASAARTLVVAAAASGGRARAGKAGGSSDAAAASSPPSPSSTRIAAVKEALDAFGRPALHARHLAFDHPVTGERLSFDCGLPEDMVRLLEGLGEALGGC